MHYSIFSRGCLEVSFTYILTCIAFWYYNNKVHTMPFLRLNNMPQAGCAHLVSLIKLGDAFIRSFSLRTGIYFCPYPQLKRGKDVWWKALWLASQNSLSAAQLFSAVPPICLQLQSLCNQTYLQPVTIFVQPNRWWLWHQMNNFTLEYTVELVQQAFICLIILRLAMWMYETHVNKALL